ncbi:hypothetical protein FVEN_g2177 [Fusarium venenatum]|uniref:Zn(2)-C6 fungal-type domain-containing protein n=1 Tax=Fusarium venenatum TaxID=56646 RepID=A0A2L2SPR3_9HYPO|nr:uncharacterized protein FVRRES_12595 [Fusarium venenatum]KAG8360343.1 hypothetical protein FVEN_g2177 [Fusarium venenatum]KAH6979197.1 fungal-specific transcription factor domain-containing protein [Fusarium venenatum]CEI39904.1 unnamed protein product [Fusarium venenatum]
MARLNKPLSTRPTARRKDPACGTCRKKCRKCDRKRPICDRCRTKGLQCEGYPPKFQFQNSLTVVSDESEDNTNIQDSIKVRQSPQESLLSAESPDANFPIFDPQQALLDVSDTSFLSPIFALTPVESPPQLSIAQVDSDPIAASDIDLDSDIIANQYILYYFDQILSERLAIHVTGLTNPFREHVLPLAHKHQGILHALLGLALCHMYNTGNCNDQDLITASLGYRLSAIRSVAALLLQEETSTLTRIEEEYLLAMVLLLVLHDICESGVSTHGAHLTGISFLCKRMAGDDDISTRSKAGIFLISALSWLDMLRGFSGAEKLSYSEDVRECVRDHGSLSLHTLVGCPPVIFFKIGQVLEGGKSYLAGDLTLQQFEKLLDSAEKFLRGWDPEQAVYPTAHREWRQLAEAYRHACLLRIMRFPDTFAVSCDDSRIKESVTTILDICAVMPSDSVFYKRLLFPLFLAGADTCSPHQMHYASLCIDNIKRSTGFQHPAMMEVLSKVWEGRRTNPHGWSNVPWMEYTCSELLQSQHAYLFF